MHFQHYYFYVLSTRCPSSLLIDSFLRAPLPLLPSRKLSMDMTQNHRANFLYKLLEMANYFERKNSFLSIINVWSTHFLPFDWDRNARQSRLFFARVIRLLLLLRLIRLLFSTFIYRLCLILFRFICTLSTFSFRHLLSAIYLSNALLLRTSFWTNEWLIVCVHSKCKCFFRLRSLFILSRCPTCINTICSSFAVSLILASSSLWLRKKNILRWNCNCSTYLRQKVKYLLFFTPILCAHTHRPRHSFV